MSFPGVSVCVEVVNESTCTGGAVYDLPPFEVSASAWVATVASGAPGAACSGSPTFKPVAQVLSSDLFQSVDISTSVCTNAAASAFTFGVGGITPPFDLSQLDATQVSGGFAAGFLLVAMFWGLGWAVARVLDVVRR